MRVKTGTDDADVAKRMLRLGHHDICVRFGVSLEEAYAIAAKFDFCLLATRITGI